MARSSFSTAVSSVTLVLRGIAGLTPWPARAHHRLVETIQLLGTAMGLGAVAGINLYATVLAVGLGINLGLITPSPELSGLAALGHPLVVLVAGTMYTVEFFADKIPWVDTLWDTVHTFIRPVGGAFVAVAGLGDASPATQGMIALLGGIVAASSHATKAGTRVVANTSPEPVSNWVLSLFEDGLVVGLGILAMQFPVAALAVTLLLLLAMAMLAATIVRAIRRRFRATPPAAEALT